MKFLLIVATAIVVCVVFAICKDLAKNSRNAESSIRWMLFIGVAVVAVMWWVAFRYYGERPESDVKVSEIVFSSYPKEQYPKTYKAWGASGVEEIKQLERLAAVKAARQRKCDDVYSIALSEK